MVKNLASSICSEIIASLSSTETLKAVIYKGDHVNLNSCNYSCVHVIILRSHSKHFSRPEPFKIREPSFGYILANKNI